MNSPLLNQLLDEYWRYQCPTCDCHTIAVRTHLRGPAQHSEGQTHDEFNQAHLRDADIDVHVHDYRCNGCGDTFDCPYDKMRGECHALPTAHLSNGGD
jgi:hypothetical protein